MLFFVAWNIISAVYNSMIGKIDLLTGLLFSLRHIEYLMFIVVGYVLGSNNKELQPYFIYYVFFCVILIAFQSWGLVGTLSGFGTSRGFVANTGGPWEFAAVCAFLTIFFYYTSRYKAFWILSFALLVGTQSRITTVAVLLVAVIRIFYSQLKKNPLSFFLAVWGLVVILAALVGCYFFMDIKIDIIERFSLLFTHESYDAIETLYSNLSPVHSQNDYYKEAYGSGFLDVAGLGGDTSSMVRFSRWIILIRSVFADGFAPFIGLGPSFAFLAVDGNYVRIFAESGFIGLALFWLFLYSVYKNSKNDVILLSYLFILCVTALFIDIFTTYKAMLLFWLYLGWSWGKRKQLQDYGERV